MQVPEHPDEHLLDEVLGALPVPDGPVDEVEEAGLIAVHQGTERLGVSPQVLEHEPPVVELVERAALEPAPGRDGFRFSFEDVLEDGSHDRVPWFLAETEWAHRPSVSYSLDTARTVPVAGHLQLPARQWVGLQRPSRTGVLSW